jgi:hypothetical protein
VTALALVVVVSEKVLLRLAQLDANDVGRARTLRGLFDSEFEFLSLFEVRAADVFHVEEHVIVRILGGYETVTASVVEEVNRTFRHCD